MNDLTHLVAALVVPNQFAPEFDPAFYIDTQPDLAHFDDAELRDHYELYGRDEGRCASPAAFRQGFVAQICPDRPTLEIGPAVRPTLRGKNVRYFEISDRDGLVARAKREGYDHRNCPDRIHYVSETADLTSIPDRFDAVFSSHCIEHQPDLIAHLTNVAALLDPGGRYHLLIPDKRYCFDSLLPESDLDRVRLAHQERRTVHSFESVLEHRALTTHNDTARHWRGDHVDVELVANQAARVLLARSDYARADGGYVDVHAWQFTPGSFRTILDGLRDSLPFRVERIYETPRDRNEFGAILRRQD